MKVDKMSMSVSLEARVPFLDHRIVELVAGMPADLKWRGGSKYLLKRAAARLVPEDIIRRRKHGFRLPLDRWFRAELKPLAAELLTGSRTRQRALFDRQTVDRLWTAYLGGRDDCFMPIWLLLNFEVWCRVFLDRDVVEPPRLAAA